MNPCVRQLGQGHRTTDQAGVRILGTNKLATLNEQDISLFDLIAAAWRFKWVIMGVAIGFALIGGIAAKLVPKQFQATVIISPVSDDSGSSRLGGLSSVLADVGGLSSSLAGIGASGNSQRSEYIAILQSEALTENYIRSHNLLQVIYPKLWDSSRNGWRDNNPAKHPSLWKANQLFKRSIRTVLVDAKTGLVTMSIKWTNPVDAAKWANDLVALANDYIRTKAIAQSQRNISYLNDQASKTDVVGIKQAIYSLIQTEISKLMLAQGRTEYALKVIDPAIPPEQATSPIALIWATSGGFIGLLVSSVALYLHLYKIKLNATPQTISASK